MMNEIETAKVVARLDRIITLLEHKILGSPKPRPISEITTEMENLASERERLEHELRLLKREFNFVTGEFEEDERSSRLKHEIDFLSREINELRGEKFKNI